MINAKPASRFLALVALTSIVGCHLNRPKPNDPSSATPALDTPIRVTKAEPTFKMVNSACETTSTVLEAYDAGSKLTVVILPEIHANTGSSDYGLDQMDITQSHFRFAGDFSKKFTGVSMFLEGNKGFGTPEFREDLALLKRILGQDPNFTDEELETAIQSNPVFVLIKSANHPVLGLEDGPNASEVTTLGSIFESHYSAMSKIVLRAQEGNTVMLPINKGQTPEELFQIPTHRKAVSSCKTEAGRSVPLIDSRALANLKRVSQGDSEYIVLDSGAISAIAKACSDWFDWMDRYSLAERNAIWADKLLAFQENEAGEGQIVAVVACGVNHVSTPSFLKAPSLPDLLKKRGISYIVTNPVRPN